MTAADVGTRGLPDETVLSIAAAAGRVLVTNDSDFLRCHRDGVRHAGIAYYPRHRMPIGELAEILILLYEVSNSDEMTSHVEYL
jgi:hypothetical protein